MFQLIVSPDSDGAKEPLNIDKIVAHLESLCYDLNKAFVKPVSRLCFAVANAIQMLCAKR